MSVRIPSFLKLTTLTFHLVFHDWVIKDLDMSSWVCVTAHLPCPCNLSCKSRALCPGGGLPTDPHHHNHRLDMTLDVAEVLSNDTNISLKKDALMGFSALFNAECSFSC